MENLLQNIHWPTFFISIAVFIVIANVYNLILAKIKLNISRDEVKKVETELRKMQEVLEEKSGELDRLLSGKGELKK